MVDTLRFPFFNDPNTIGVTYYSGYETGLAYFDGSPIDYFYERVQAELDARAQNKTVDYGPNHGVPDCHIPLKEQIGAYEPRCRPWYQKAWKNPGQEILVTYPSLNFQYLWVSLSRTIHRDGVPFGIAAIDIDTSFLSDIFYGQVFDSVQDYFLITIPE